MSQYIIKLLISAAIIVLASEVSKRNTVLAALIIALPLVSLITFSSSSSVTFFSDSNSDFVSVML